MPLGIVSIIYSTKVDTAYNDGNYALAESSSKKAKNWGIASMVTIGVILILYVIIMLIAVAAGAIDA